MRDILTNETLRHRKRIYGIDFSGAKDAGRRIWVAAGVIEDNALRIETCLRADNLPESGRGLELCLPALRNLVASESAGVFGFDFPFGLPRGLGLAEQESWESFILSFPDRFAGSEEFREACRAVSRRPELKRVTDTETQAPLSPYNLRLYRQTYFGIRDLLFPLVRDRRACVLPMQRVLPDKPWILEICPALTLKDKEINLYLPGYKRGTVESSRARAQILQGIEDTGLIHIASEDTRAKILNNRGGDALDSVIAALAVFRALSDLSAPDIESSADYALEGRIYV